MIRHPRSAAMLYIVGLGLGDERDITVRGLDAVRSCSKVFMEAYTSLLSLGLDPAALANLVRALSLPLFCHPAATCSSKCLRGLFGELLLTGVVARSCVASRRSCTGRGSRLPTGRWWRSASIRCCSRLLTQTSPSLWSATRSGNSCYASFPSFFSWLYQSVRAHLSNKVLDTSVCRW